MEAPPKIRRSALASCALATLLLATATGADEGMWTYDKVPVRLIQERYGFAPTQELLDHIRLSSLRMYASAAFVSPDGLILTNHHVALGLVQQLSTPERNLVQKGFYAPTLADELPCPGGAVQVLVSIEDVTERVERAVKPLSTPAESRAQREAARAAIEKAASAPGGTKGEVVTLFGGAKHALYLYKEYTDIRLVFAPELDAAFFGGDFDNFTYPRYDFDLAFLRAYENGKPAHPEHFLRTNPDGSKDGDLVFVSGHPGNTDRLLTTDQLAYLREVVFPAKLADLARAREVALAYSSRGPEPARRARTLLYFLGNSSKAREGEQRGLMDAGLMARKSASERALTESVDRHPALKAKYGSAWEGIRTALAWARQHEKERRYKKEMPGSRLCKAALNLLRYPAEIAKPDADRLKDFHDAELPDLERDLVSPRPHYKDLEEALLADSLTTLERELGSSDPFVQALLQGFTPAETARRALAGTRLDEASYRKELLAGGGRAVGACKDPLIELARRADPILRATAKLFKDNLEAVEEQELTRIAQSRFAVFGDAVYPDATGTLRLTFGKVAGYPFATTLVPPFTTFYGLFDRAYSFGNKGDFALTRRQEESRDSLDLSVPLNTVNTCDITGGNSGSPVVDREGRLVGLVFDGNATSHSNSFVYDEQDARCVCVDVRGILEGLRKIYGAGALADEMIGTKG